MSDFGARPPDRHTDGLAACLLWRERIRQRDQQRLVPPGWPRAQLNFIAEKQEQQQRRQERERRRTEENNKLNEKKNGKEAKPRGEEEKNEKKPIWL